MSPSLPFALYCFEELPSEMEVAPRYTLLTLLTLLTWFKLWILFTVFTLFTLITLFILFNLLYTVNTLIACTIIYICNVYIVKYLK